MIRSVKPAVFLSLTGLSAFVFAALASFADRFTTITIVYNGYLVLLLMALVIGIGKRRRARMTSRPSDQNLPMYWPSLLFLTLVFLGTADSMGAFKVVQIAMF